MHARTHLQYAAALPCCRLMVPLAVVAAAAATAAAAPSPPVLRTELARPHRTARMLQISHSHRTAQTPDRQLSKSVRTKWCPLERVAHTQHARTYSAQTFTCQALILCRTFARMHARLECHILYKTRETHTCHPCVCTL